jgi:hypothetical protein
MIIQPFDWNHVARAAAELSIVVDFIRRNASGAQHPTLAH